ncbi:MAG: TIGR04282 family arsenosugar biosynthesis glycosyltransferase [Leptolyngbyaceae cyanobacterium bins.302]|nr:TIGR04282 family arsenosugar biosynthesis glycosyltransferase [Leptolyngbyaceae cyanobacterium bins.302]
MSISTHLLIFTRYPKPGLAKTRLIPALGENGAAILSRQLTEHTLAQVHQLQQYSAMSVEIYFAGGTLDLMQQWLGSGWSYIAQAEGNLGDRMAQAFQSAFASGMQPVILIGSDCPELNPSILLQAEKALADHDLVLGPAEDGGYYLIGLRRLIPELLAGISWSTAAVLQQTLAIAQQMQLTVSLLPVLRDIDHPEDLGVWQRINQSQQ